MMPPDTAGVRARYGERLRIGMILPCRNTVAEPELNGLLPRGASLHTTRLRLLGYSRDELLQMTRNVEDAADLLAAAEVDLIAFHCTAVSTLDADMGERLVERIQQTAGIPSIATSLAILAALATIDAQRIVMVTPYRQSINESEAAYFAHHGVEVLQHIGLGLPDAKSMARVEPGEWFRHTAALKRPDADAYFLSCTNIQAMPVIDALERELDAPVITSNQAMLWHALRKSGLSDALAGCGALLREH